ncbi:MAG: tetratricopeptide repeat protein [Planctomycetota bacterium]
MADPRTQDFPLEERRLKAAGQWRALLDLYVQESERLDPAGRERMLYKAGEVASDELVDPAFAEQMFMRAFKVRGSFMPAIGALRVLHQSNKNQAGLLEVLRLELEATEDPRRRSQLNCEIADLLRGKDPEKALEAYSQAIKANPKSRQPLDELEKLARKLGKFSLLVQAYEALASVAPSKQAAVYYFLGGTVLFENLRDTAAAAAAYNAALDAQPKDPRILKAIVRHFEKQKDWEGLAKALWQQLELAEDDKERVAARKRLAYLYESNLGQPERAQAILIKAIKEAPGDQTIVKSLIKLSGTMNDPRGLAEGLEAKGALTELGEEERAAAWEEAAELRDKLKDGKRAYADVQEALKLQPRSPRGLKMLERVTRKMGRWDEHDAVLGRELALLNPGRSAEQTKAAVAILKRQAETRELKLKDPAKARLALEQVVELAPEEGWAWDRLLLMARKAEDWTGLVRQLERRRQGAEDQAPLLREIAEVRRKRLGDLPGAVAALDALLELEADDVAALEALASALEEQKDQARLADTLTRLARALPEPPRQAAVRRQLARIQLRELDQAEEALAEVERSLKLEPEGAGALEAWKLRAEAAEKLGDDEALEAALGGVKRFEQDPATLRWVRIQLAKLQERAGNAEGALGTMQEILSEVPDDPDALPVAVRLYRQLGRLEEGVSALETAALVAEGDPERAHAFLSDLGRLLEEDVKDASRARVAWMRALRAAPEDGAAFARATTLARGQGAEAELYALLTEVVVEVKHAERRQAYLREQAQLARAPLGERAKSIKHYEQLKDLLPRDLEAAEALRDLYRELERWEDLAALLEEQAAGGPITDAASCLREVAAVAERRLEDLPRAAQALERVGADLRDPQDPAWAALAELYARLEQPREQLRVLLRAAELAQKKGALPSEADAARFRAERLAEAARVAEERLRDYPQAAALLRQGLEAAPGSAPGSLEMLESLARVLEAASEHAEAERVLARAAEAPHASAAQRAGFHLQRGRLLEGPLADPALAEEAYQAAIAADPSQPRGREALIALLERLGRWEPLQQALGDAAAASAGEARADYLVRRGEVLTHELERLDEALQAFDAAEEARPRGPRARQARVVALRGARRPEALTAALAARREAEPLELDTTEHLRLLREEAELRAFSLSQLEPGRELLLEGLKRRSKDLATLRVLLRIERQLGLGKPLAQHLEATADLETEAEVKASLLVEAGRVLRTRGGEPERARGLFQRALKADPQRIEAVRWLQTLAKEGDDHKAEATWLEEEAKLEQDPRRRALLYTRLGHLHGQRNPKAARAAFERALEHDAQHVDALRGLAPMLRRDKAWAELDKVLGELSRSEPDPRYRLERLVAMGDLRLRALDDRQGARESFEAALGLEPREPRALRGRAATFDPRDEAAPLVAALRAELEATPRAERRVALAKRIAALQQDQLDDSQGAVQTLEEVLRLRPQDAEAWKRLRAAHVQRRDWDAMAKSYEREARVRREVREQEELFRSAAMIAEHHLKDDLRAAELYREVLDRGDPECLAVRVLPKLLRRAGEERALEEVLARICEVVPRTDEAAAALRELGQRAEARGEQTAAIGHYEASLLHVPSSLEALDRLAALHEARREWERLVRVLRRKRELAREADGFALTLRLAEVQEKELHDPAGAIEELGAADEVAVKLASPERGRLLDWLARLARQLERFELLASVLERQARASADEPTAAQLWIQRGELERDRLHDRRAAIQSYQEAFARQPSAAALEPQVALLAEEELWEDLVRVLSELAERAPSAEQRADARAQQARVLDEHLRRADDAIAVFEQALDMDPERRGVYRELEAVCQRTSHRRAHARTLERELAILGKEPEALVARALQAARLYEDLQLPAKATEVLERARAAAPLDRAVFAELDRLYQADGQAHALYALLADRAERVEEQRERIELHCRCAELCDGDLGKPAEAQRHWESVVALDPAHPDATLALKGTFAGQKSWERLAEVMGNEVSARRAREAEGQPDPGLATLYLALGEVLEGRLRRAPEATEAFRAAHARATGDERPLRGLERLHAAAGAWEELVQVREALRDLSGDAQTRCELSLGIANAYAELGRNKDAVAALEAALEEVPDDRAVLARLRRLLLEEERWQDAAAVLAREADAAPGRSEELALRLERAELVRDRLADAPEAIAEFERARGLSRLDPRPLLALDALYQAKGDVPRRVEVLEARAVLEEDDRAAGALYAEAGQLNLEGDPARAAQSHERALLRQPRDARTLATAIELYERLDRASELASALHRRAELARDERDDPAEWLRRAAKVEEERLSSARRAATTLETLLQGAPEDERALAELARLRGALGEHAAHTEVLARRAALAQGEARRALLLERAQILDEKLDRPAAAAACLKAATETLAQGERAPRRELAGRRVALLERAAEPLELLAAAEEALTHAGDAADEAALLRKVGELTAGPVYRPARAIEVFRELYRRDPGAAREPLEALYRREARHAELAELWRSEVERLGSSAEGLRLRYRLGELLSGPLQSPEGAEEQYRAVLVADAGQEPARDALEALYRTRDRLEPLAELLEERVGRALNDEEAARLRLEQAPVSERLQRPDAALSQLEDALRRAREPGARGRALRNLVRLYRQQRRSQELARALKTFAEEPQLAVGERSALKGELGTVLARELERPDEAIDAFADALRLDPLNVPAARGLAELYRSKGRWREVAGVYEQEAKAKVDKGRRVWLWAQVGRIRQRLGELPAARDAYRRALELDEQALLALRGLAEVSRELGDFPELAGALEELAALSPSPVDRQEARRELAQVSERHLQDFPRAARWYQAVIEDTHDDREALAGLGRALEALGDVAGLVGVLERQLGLAKVDEERHALALRAARLRDQLGQQARDPALRRQQQERALELAQMACELRAEDADALGFYAGVAEALGRWQELADATCRMAEVIDDTKRAAWMFMRAAKVRSLRLSDARGAADANLAAAELQPGDPQPWTELVPLAEEVRDLDLRERALIQLLQLALRPAKRVPQALALGRHHLERDQLPEAIEAFTLARAEARGPHVSEALEALEQALRRAERWEELTEVIAARVQKGDLQEPDRRQLLIERALLLEEKLSRHDLALAVLRQLHEEEPADQRVTHQLERLLSLTRRFDELVQLYESEAQRRGRGGYDSLVLLGRLARDQMDDPVLAASALQRAVTLNPGGADALEHLKELYTRTERWAELLDTLRLEIGLVKDPRQREKRLRQAGQLAEEKLGDLATAERFYAEAAGLAPRDRALLAALARVQEGRGEWQGFTETLRKDLALSNPRDRAEQLGIRRRIAATLADKLVRPHDAIEAYRKVLEVDGNDADALRRLTELLREQREWGELTQTLEQRLRLEPNSLPLRLELARVNAERLDQPAPAVQAAEQALVQDPSCREAAELLVHVQRRFNGAPAGLANALQRLAQLCQGDERAEVLLELAVLLRDRLAQPDHAVNALRDAFRAAPTHDEATDALLDELSVRGLKDELVRVCEAGAQAEREQGFRAGKLLARGAAALEGEDPAKAERHYRAAVKAAPGHLPALEGLARLLGRRETLSAQEAQELVRLHLRRARVEPDPTLRAAALVSAGDVLRDRLELFEAAQQQYEKALEHAPSSLPALASLAELSYAAGDMPRAAKFFDRLAGSASLNDDPQRAAELCWARGDCCLKLGQRERAVASFRDALRFRPGHLQALEDLAKALTDDGAWAAARPVLEDLIQRTSPPKLKAAHVLTLAKVQAELGAQDAALEHYRAGLEQLPQRYDAHLQLARLLRERDPAASKRHFDFVLAGDDLDAQAEARLELAELCEVVLQQPDHAAGHLQEALKLPGKHRARAARRLAEVHGRQERWQDAAHSLRRAIELVEDDTERAVDLANLGRVLRDRLDQASLARQCFERALELQPGDKRTLDSLLRLLQTAGDLPGQARLLGLAADHARDSAAGDEAALRLRRAEVLVELKDPQGAVKDYERVLALDPEHSGARAALGGLYLEVGDSRGVEKIHRRLIKQDPFAVTSYQALAKAWGEANDADAHAQAAQVLVALRAARAKERVAVESRGQSMPRTKAQVKDEDFAKTIVHPDCRGLIRDFLWQVGPHLLKQLPDDLKGHGIGWRTPRYGIEGDAFPEHAMLKRICDLLGITQLDVYWMPDWRRPEPVLGTSKGVPALILCPEVFSGLTEAGKAFVLARFLGMVKLNLHFFRLVPADQARLWIWAALKGFDAARTFPGHDDRNLKGVIKALAKVPELHKPLEPLHKELWRSKDQIDWQRLPQAVALTGSRAGLLVAGGMYAATEAIVHTNMSLRGRVPDTAAGVLKLFREVPELCDLAPFSVSKGYLKLRAASLRTDF